MASTSEVLVAVATSGLMLGRIIVAIVLRCLAIERGSVAICAGGSAVCCRRLAVSPCGKASLVFGFRGRVVGQPVANRGVHVATLSFSVATFGFDVATVGVQVATFHVCAVVLRGLLAFIAHDRSLPARRPAAYAPRGRPEEPEPMAA